MKKLQKLMNCLEAYIKKNFFSLPKTDITQDCEKVWEINFPDENENEEMVAEEYVNNYNSTTRWQTL